MLGMHACRGLLVGTITNGNADAWAVPGLRDVIHFAVDAHSAGAAKPAPPVFHLALTKAAEVGDGCTVIEPSEVVHIGDDLTSDVRVRQVICARALGRRA
jgi:FMN phosphatase YigB (HAD superfamily)